MKTNCKWCGILYEADTEESIWCPACDKNKSEELKSIGENKNGKHIRRTH